MNTLLEAAGGMSAILGSPIFMFVLVIAIMYFMMIRPQRKRQKELDNFRRGLQPGQDIITSGGIYGKIKSVEDNVVAVEVSHNVVIRIDKNSVYASPAAIQQQENK